METRFGEALTSPNAMNRKFEKSTYLYFCTHDPEALLNIDPTV